MPSTSSAKSTYRLFKVASELNIGKETIVEFLHGKGFDIADKPTSALSQEMYDLVMEKFEKEHRQIEKQRKKVDAYHEKHVKRAKDETPAPAAAATPAKKSSKKEEAESEAPAQPVVEAPAETPVEVEAPVQEAPVVEAPPVVEQTPEPVVAEVPAEPAPVEAPVVEQAPEPEPVVEAPVAEAPPVVEEAPVVEQAPEPVVEPVAVAPEPVVEVETPTVEAEAPVVEAEAPIDLPQTPEVAVVAEDVTAADEGEVVEGEVVIDETGKKTFKATPPKLQGLTVLGKIDLGKKDADKDGDKKSRRKRKRIREAAQSVNIAQEAQNRTTGVVRPASGDRPGGTGTPTTPARPTTAGTGAGAGDKNKKKRGRGNSISVDQGEVSKAIRQTMSAIGDQSSSARQKRSRQRRDAREERNIRRMEEDRQKETVLHVTEFLTVAELANLMSVDVSQVIGKCIGLGLMVSINQRLDKDTIQLVADEFGYSIEFQQDYAEDLLKDADDEPGSLRPRAPIVTIMGHVDHGKTSLLDYIRSANVVAGEAGGITQHIGAYSVELPDGRSITFLDTPGHEAFTAMRARGAQITDIVILVVAADDSVMPQTIEAISHAQAANVPMVVAINKVDKPEANPERIKQQLSERGVLVEEWGGRYQAVEISAKKGMGVDKLLETILLEAELLDLKANPDREARGVIIEAEIDKGKGIVATALIQKGTLRVGDNFVAGQYAGRVRALLDERGNRLEKVGPSEPAQILGLGGVPTAGDQIVVLGSEQDTREIAIRRQQLRREQKSNQVRHRTLDEISSQIALGGVQHLPLLIKGDVDGSVEALADSLLRLSTPEVQVSVVMKSVGEISESDVLLAAASEAIIIGFHVRPNLKARKLAEREGVEIRTYQIIYDTVNEIRAALEGMLRPDQKEIITGTVEVRDIFKISRIGVIAGCYVLDGKITRNDRVRLLRDGLEVFNGTIGSLKRLKEDVREVEQGYECGLTLDNMNDIKTGDIIEAYKMIEVKRKLEPAGSY